jgi:hypothetical protein
MSEVKEMKWMEVIKLRMAEKEPQSVEQKILKLIKDVGNGRRIKDIKLYHNVLVGNDLSINLYWESGKAEPQGSTTGLCLVHILREYGLISHSVWVEGNQEHDTLTLTLGDISASAHTP